MLHDKINPAPFIKRVGKKFVSNFKSYTFGKRCGINKKTAILVVSILAVFLFSHVIFAQIDTNLTEVGEAAGLSGQDIRITIAKIIRNIFGFLGIITVGIFVYAGFLYMTAGGDINKVTTAKLWMKNAVIGIVIMLSAFGITQFIINSLLDAAYRRGISRIAERVPFDPLSGSLGRGIVQTHYPGRSDTDIPRNTMISITFKEPMMVEDIIEDTNENGIYGDEGDLINASNIQISLSDEREDGPYLTNIFARSTEDHQTFVFDPEDYLGSASENSWYTVAIGADIRLANETPAFVGAFADGYQWEFEVGTFLDLIPPQIQSVVPRTGTHPRNIIIQINFDEPVDPTSASGNVEIVGGAPVGFRSIRVRDEAGFIAGKFAIGNGYRTVEFSTNVLCGVNSCGGDVYCLPGNADITTTVYAEFLGAEPPASDGFPYDGIVDMVGNSLDGNGNGVAEGPGFSEEDPIDNFIWSFSTNNNVDLVPPTIERITPDIREGGVDLDAPVNITFDKIMSATTLNNSNVIFLVSPFYELWYDTRNRNLTEIGEPAGIDDEPVKTSLELRHGPLAPSDEEIRFDYFPGVTSGVKDVMQNCFYPGAGMACEATPTNPYCCDGNSRGELCDFLPL